MKAAVELALIAVGLYLACGVVFAGAYQAMGLRRLVPAALSSGIGFRLIITPGLVGLWPIMAWQWWRAAHSGTFLGEVESPVAPDTLRALHRLAWQALAVLVPLLLAAALRWRPPSVPGSSIPVRPSTVVPTPALKSPG